MLYDELLKNIKTKLKNPFKDGCLLRGIETYSAGVKIHKVAGVKLIFSENTCTIKFRKEDGVVACALAYTILSDPFGYDQDATLLINKKKFSSGDISLQKLVDSLEDVSEITKITIIFSESAVFLYHKQVLSYLVTMDKADNYFLNKEYKR